MLSNILYLCEFWKIEYQCAKHIQKKVKVEVTSREKWRVLEVLVNIDGKYFMCLEQGYMT